MFRYYTIKISSRNIFNNPNICDISKLKTVIRHPIKNKPNKLENIDEEHICCAIGDPKHQKGVDSKKEWIKTLSKYGFGVSIDTKSDLILRDIDLLKEINSKNNVIIKFTITTPNDELSKIIEPNICVSSKRFDVIKELSNNGIFCRYYDESYFTIYNR